MLKRMGRYEVTRLIASGGMGRVYLGRAHGTGGIEGFERVVALKVMHPHIAESRDHVAMFIDEARLAARIRHPNVVATLDIAESPEAPFIVMEFVEGPSLSRIRRILKKRDERLPVTYTVRILLDLLAGLHAAHEIKGPDGKLLNLVHRDVSPQNILVGCDGVTRVSDFGVARAELRIATTQTGQLKGKLNYMPPEQVRGKPIDRRADVYSAAALLWEVLVGRRLIRATNEGEIIYEILEGNHLPPRKLNYGVPQEISDACMKGLSLEPADRYPTAAAFAEALEDAAETAGTPIATSRKLAAYIDELHDSLEQDEPSDVSGLRWLPSSPGNIGTPLSEEIAKWGTSASRPRVPRPSAPQPEPAGVKTGDSSQSISVDVDMSDPPTVDEPSAPSGPAQAPPAPAPGKPVTSDSGLAPPPVPPHAPPAPVPAQQSSPGLQPTGPVTDPGSGYRPIPSDVVLATTTDELAALSAKQKSKRLVLILVAVAAVTIGAIVLVATLSGEPTAADEGPTDSASAIAPAGSSDTLAGEPEPTAQPSAAAEPAETPRTESSADASAAARDEPTEEKPKPRPRRPYRPWRPKKPSRPKDPKGYHPDDL